MMIITKKQEKDFLSLKYHVKFRWSTEQFINYLTNIGAKQYPKTEENFSSLSNLSVEQILFLLDGGLYKVEKQIEKGDIVKRVKGLCSASEFYQKGYTFRVTDIFANPENGYVQCPEGHPHDIENLQLLSPEETAKFEKWENVTQGDVLIYKVGNESKFVIYKGKIGDTIHFQTDLGESILEASESRFTVYAKLGGNKQC